MLCPEFRSRASASAGASFAESAKIANYAGGIVVMKMGTATVSNDELRRAVERDEALPE